MPARPSMRGIACRSTAASTVASSGKDYSSIMFAVKPASAH
jgi:hypothetical protein